MSILLELIKSHKQGSCKGVYCVCSAHPLVIEAAITQAMKDGQILIIEATSNQVDQFGGYTGMKPEDFKNFVYSLANKYLFPLERLVLGGDHLGPNRWQKTDNAEQAMLKADKLIEAYVEAGFTKIHLDCSMSCVGDPVPLTDEIVASRAARLAKIAEETAINKFGKSNLVYCIGTEVPVPGGAHEVLNSLEVTSTEAAKKTIEAHQLAFNNQGLDIWNRVIGLVVQPGVEFDHLGVIDYDPSKTTELSQLINDYDYLVYEAHSTDYQNDEAYVDLVKNHFAILKVGPALTYVLREALYKLAYIEDIVINDASQRSNLIATIDQQMLSSQPDYWSSYYHGSPDEQKFARSYSFSDRIRYYWPNPEIQQAVNTLFSNLSSQKIPLPLLSHFFPEQYKYIRLGQLDNDPKAITLDSIAAVNRIYSRACQGNTNF